MKSIMRFTAALAVLALVITACERPASTPDGAANNDPKERVIVYRVEHTENRQTLKTEGEWDALLDVLCNQAQNGHKVTFFNLDQTSHLQAKGTKSSKAAKTFSTTSREKMKEWMKEMEKEGRTVVVTYNDSDGTWNGVAYATAPPSDTSATIIGTWHFSCLVRHQLGADGCLVGSELYVPEEDGGAMYYTFNSDGTMAMIFHSADGTSVTENSTWALDDEGKLHSDLLPNENNWDVNWVSDNTLIISIADFGTSEGDFLYQMQFDREKKNPDL